MKILAAVNPISGGVDKKPFLRDFKGQMKMYGIEYQIFNTTGKDDNRLFSKSLQEFQPDKVISVGGDGTTLFTAINLMQSTVPFGIIPLGSANGMATELGVEKDPLMALSDIIQTHHTCPLDLILVNELHYCLHIGDVGINANIVEDFSNDGDRGMLSYAKYFADRIQSSEEFTITLKINGEEHVEKGYMVAIANARKYGTGVVLNYYGNPTDGKFEIAIIKSIDARTMVRAGLSKFNEEFSRESDTKTYSCTSVEISLDKPRILQLDGEIIGKQDKINASIIANAVNLVTTTKNPFFN